MSSENKPDEQGINSFKTIVVSKKNLINWGAENIEECVPLLQRRYADNDIHSLHVAEYMRLILALKRAYGIERATHPLGSMWGIGTPPVPVQIMLVK